MAKRVSKSQIGDTMTGRMLSFERVRGYGFIRTSTNQDIFLSSYGVPRNIWKKISVGDYLEFVVGINEKNDKVVATNVTIIKKMPRLFSILLPSGEELEVRHIYQFGRGSLIKDGYKSLYPDYPYETFDYVFIKTSERTYVFNQHGSPVVIDGETDVDEFYLYLTNLLTEYDIDQDYESF